VGAGIRVKYVANKAIITTEIRTITVNLDIALFKCTRSPH